MKLPPASVPSIFPKAAHHSLAIPRIQLGPINNGCRDPMMSASGRTTHGRNDATSLSRFASARTILRWLTMRTKTHPSFFTRNNDPFPTRDLSTDALIASEHNAQLGAELNLPRWQLSWCDRTRSDYMNPPYWREARHLTQHPIDEQFTTMLHLLHGR